MTGPTVAKAVTTTCKSCRHFTVDKLRFARHAEAGLGQCGFDNSTSKFRSLTHACARYDATDKRKAYLAFQEGLQSA